MLAEAAESVVCAVEMVRQTQWAEWMNRKQMVRSLGRVLTPPKKVVARREIPRHYLTERNILSAVLS